jgi:hypothetical protein
VWADARSRRVPLALAPLLAAAGFALWVLAPSYPVFALGFVLWGAQGALQSGALEAVVFEELERRGDAAAYPRLMGRASAAGTIASAAALGVAAPLFALGGFGAAAAASVAACLAAAVVGAGFPEPRADGGAPAAGPAAVGMGAVGALLRTALADLRASAALRALLVAVPLVTAVWGSLDEYLPLLAVEAGAGTAAVSLLGLLVYAAMSLGGLAAGRAGALPARRIGVVLAAAGLLLAGGALTRAVPGFVAVAASFALFQAVTVAVDARLQGEIAGPARSTTTSLAALLCELLVLGVFAGYAAGSAIASHAVLFAVAGALYVPVAFALVWAMSPARARRR